MRESVFIIILFFITSCENKNIYIIKNEKNDFFNLIDYKNDSIKIKKNDKPKIFFSLDTECPLCKSYVKKINDLHLKYKVEIDFYGFFPTSVFSEEKMNQFITDYNFKMPLIVDTNQIVTHFLDATVTPECFLLDKNLNTIYQGLIDDWIKELGRKGQSINNHYLNKAIISYLNDEAVIIKKTNAIGCIIEK